MKKHIVRRPGALVLYKGHPTYRVQPRSPHEIFACSLVRAESFLGAYRVECHLDFVKSCLRSAATYSVQLIRSLMHQYV